MLTQGQRDYIRMLEQVKDDNEIVVELGSSDEELRWYLRRHPRRDYAMTIWLIGLLPERTGDFWMSCLPAVDAEAVLKMKKVGERAMWRHRDEIPWLCWDSYVTRGCTEWLLKRLKGTNYARVDAMVFSKPLSERFMRRNKDWIDWNDVALYQPMGRKFLEEFESRLDYALLCRNIGIDSRTLAELVVNHGGSFGKRAYKRRNAL